MQYIDDYRNNTHIQTLARAINRKVAHEWNIMEICGGQTYAIARYRLEDLLPPEVRLLHGPGCPVCVTSEEVIDHALDIARHPEVILASFGDMMRVPGNETDLLHLKAQGADIRLLYSPLDAVELAAANPAREVVFFAVGFETTIPVHLAALQEARRRKMTNFSLLCSFFAVAPAMEMIVQQPDNRVDGFLAAGHVCAITGNAACRRLAARYKHPVIITGFEPVDLLYGLYRCICQLERNEAQVENAYKRAVPENGNTVAQALMNDALDTVGCKWRGIGYIPDSGFVLKAKYSAYDATGKFPFENTKHLTNTRCISGEIMKGKLCTADCHCFGTECTPEHPAGAPMVSAEGVCAAYYRYRQP
ncbi:MAG: hydrogenase formation protein HypD [Bacteroidales bacterium]|jgi:hydrogenase expression/formation protein HypD|nr:hydrogenase formation protein HypD [Bacteroidales bacterium]